MVAWVTRPPNGGSGDAACGGGTRRYSDNDITRLRPIGALIGEGINLAGVARILGLEADNTAMHTNNTALQELNTALQHRQRRPPRRQPPTPQQRGWYPEEHEFIVKWTTGLSNTVSEEQGVRALEEIVHSEPHDLPPGPEYI